MSAPLLSAEELTSALELVRLSVGRHRHVVMVTFDGQGYNGQGEKPVYQYIGTTQRADTIRVLRDLADALESRPAAPNISPN